MLDLAPNSPELSLLKILPLAYHQAISWLPPWISHFFSQWLSWEPHTFFTAGLFWIRFHFFLQLHNVYRYLMYFDI